MPAHQLPWFKVWIGVTAHAKVRTLDDGVFRTWVELLDAAAQQSWRGRFKSVEEAAAITRRPVKHIRTLIAAGLIDEAPEGLTMHDWDTWQRWRKEDANDSRTTTEGPPERPSNGHVIDTRTTREGPPDQHANVDAPLREKREERRKTRDVEGDVDVDRDERTKNPPAPNGAAPRGNSKVAAVIEAFRGRGITPVLMARDYSAIKASNAEPALVAEVYEAVAQREYGDDFMRKRLNVAEAIGWVNGYVEDRAAQIVAEREAEQDAAALDAAREALPKRRAVEERVQLPPTHRAKCASCDGTYWLDEGVDLCNRCSIVAEITAVEAPA